MIGTLGAIALGGAAGALSRHGIHLGITKWLGAGFPWGTLCVNIIGSFAMGVLIARFAHGQTNISPEIRSLLTTGFLGAFTTFSTFSLDFVTLWERGEMTQAALYLTASVLLSILGLMFGLMIGRSLWA